MCWSYHIQGISDRFADKIMKEGKITSNTKIIGCASK